MKNYYLYLIRHGITEGNLDGKYIGQTDLALCPQGEKQIQQLVKAGVYPCVEKVYTSRSSAALRLRRSSIRISSFPRWTR